MRRKKESRERCIIDGCLRFAELSRGRPINGMCAAHRYRKRRGLALTPPIDEDLSRKKFEHAGRSGLNRWAVLKSDLVEAAVALVDAGEDDRLAYRRLLWVFERRRRARTKAPCTR
jgi:hypothetical protein